MSKTKENKYHRIKRKRVWPTLFVFFGFLVVCFGMIGIFVQLFAGYTMITKMGQMYENSKQVSAMMETLVKDGYTMEGALRQMYSSLPDGAACVLDNRGTSDVHIGDSRPNYGAVMELFLDEEYIVYADSNWDQHTTEVLGIPLQDVFRGAFAQRKVADRNESVSNTQWLQESIFSQKFWMEVPLSHQGQKYKLLVRCNLQILRQDVIYVCLFGACVFFILTIPICFLFGNMIKSVVVERGMIQLLYEDTVTGEKNWLCFKDMTERILLKRRNKKKTYALVNLYVERYQNFCACYGVKAGEDLLEKVAGFLKARVNKGEIFARYEGAEFGMLLCCGNEDLEASQRILQKRLRTLLVELTGLLPEKKIHFSAGAYFVEPKHYENDRWYKKGERRIDIDQCNNYANAARNSSKCHDEQYIAFFDQELLEQQMWERKVEDTMEKALQNEEFKVYLQPKYNPKDNKLVGAEALVRWISPTEGFIPPNRFIPIFEENGFITQLDDYMLAHVSKLQAEWIIQGKKVVPVSVNISRAHFSQEDLASHICDIVDSYGTRHDLIELEVTESAFFDDKDILIETVKQLKCYGFHVSMDDFGAGYSSLNSLKDIPLDVLKLDGEFFRGEDADGRGAIVVREAIQLARNLDMRVVAEGIEKREQVEFLAGQGCDMIQGFYFAKPMPVAEFEEKVEMDA